MSFKRIVAAFGLVAACLTIDGTANGRAPGHERKCSQCESSTELRQSVGIPLPANALVYDFGNGPFWRNSYLVVIDLDRGEALTYRNPPDKETPSSLQLAGQERISPRDLDALRAMARVAWNPPVERPVKAVPAPTDMFETIYVLRGPTMARAVSLGNGPRWFAELLDKIVRVARPAEHRLDASGG